MSEEDTMRISTTIAVVASLALAATACESNPVDLEDDALPAGGELVEPEPTIIPPRRLVPSR